MQCPKCGRGNPGHAQTCTLCGCDLTSPFDPTKQKTSKIAIVSLVLAVLSIFTFLLTALPAIILGCVALTKIRRSKGRLKGEHLAITAIAVPIIAFPVVLFVLHSLWKLDAPPIPNDYTIADLRSAPEDCADSYELLLSLSEEDQYRKDAPAIGLSAQDVDTIRQVPETIRKNDYSDILKVLDENADSIIQAWNNGIKGRNVIEELNEFAEIADLTEPNLAAELDFLNNLRMLCYLYQSYISLRTEQGQGNAVLCELDELDSVFRKLSVTTRSSITKLVCIAGLANSIATANFIANNPQTSQESLELLAQHFQPLTHEQTSFRNAAINEYLMNKNELKKLSNSVGPMIKFNSACRLLKNFSDDRIHTDSKSQQPKIDRLSVWPSLYPKLPARIDSDARVPWYYKAYNPMGSMFVAILLPAMERIVQIRTKVWIHDDLLQIVLNKRLGKEISLKARAYSDEYLVDLEGRNIFSPGPDGKIDTNDDIKLPINPEVLGWEN